MIAYPSTTNGNLPKIKTMAKKARKKSVRKKTSSRKKAIKKGPKKKRGRPRKKKFKFPKLSKSSSKKGGRLKKLIPSFKLITVLLLSYIAYTIGTTQIPEDTTKKDPLKRSTTVSKQVSKPTSKVASKPTSIQKKVSKPKKVVTPTVKKETVKPKPTPLPKKVTPPKKEAIIPPPKPKAKAWSSKPKLVFVIDDIGHNLENESLYRQLGRQVTYAILPSLNYSQYFSKLSLYTGAEVILHLPFETQDGTVPGPGLITGRMSPNYVIERINHNLNSVPHHMGANNHMGSLGTSDPVLVEIVLKEFKKRGLFFLDSYTSSKSVIVPVANKIGLPVLKRDIFLDNVDEQGAIRVQLSKLESVARNQGYGIAIGHDRKNTLTVIQEALPRLKREGFEIISLGELLEYKKRM